MTQETRETLTKLETAVRRMAERLDKEPGQQIAVRMWLMLADEHAAALRDVPTPRTCGTCRHLKYPGPYRASCGNPESAFRGAVFYSYEASEMDGCLKGWQAREGEGGKR